MIRPRSNRYAFAAVRLLLVRHRQPEDVTERTCDPAVGNGHAMRSGTRRTITQAPGKKVRASASTMTDRVSAGMDMQFTAGTVRDGAACMQPGVWTHSSTPTVPDSLRTHLGIVGFPRAVQCRQGDSNVMHRRQSCASNDRRAQPRAPVIATYLRPCRSTSRPQGLPIHVNRSSASLLFLRSPHSSAVCTDTIHTDIMSQRLSFWGGQIKQCLSGKTSPTIARYNRAILGHIVSVTCLLTNRQPLPGHCSCPGRDRQGLCLAC
jgi:hypothetical protein